MTEEVFVFDTEAERPLHIRPNDPHMQCPVKECSTYLQPDPHVGSLVVGTTSHLQTVHTLTPDTARVLAQRAVKDHVQFVKTMRKTRG